MQHSPQVFGGQAVPPEGPQDDPVFNPLQPTIGATLLMDMPHVSSIRGKHRCCRQITPPIVKLVQVCLPCTEEGNIFRLTAKVAATVICIGIIFIFIFFLPCTEFPSRPFIGRPYIGRPCIGRPCIGIPCAPRYFLSRQRPAPCIGIPCIGIPFAPRHFLSRQRPARKQMEETKGRVKSLSQNDQWRWEMIS